MKAADGLQRLASSTVDEFRFVTVGDGIFVQRRE
jgi:hypothetical protein